MRIDANSFLENALIFSKILQKVILHRCQGTQHLLASAATGGVGLAAGMAAATGQPTVPAAATQQLSFQQHQQVNDIRKNNIFLIM